MLENELTQNTEIAKNFWYKENINDMSWNSKACVYHRYLFKHIKIPETGSCVQLGAGFGMSLQILAEQFPGRTWGIDLWNPMHHPLIKIKDVKELEPTPLAYVHCNVGSFMKTPNLRKYAIEYSLKNLQSGGYCLTAGNHEFVESQLGYSINDIALQYNCKIETLPNGPEIDQMNAEGKFNSAHDCLIKKH